jgi:hypothetical protein
MNFAGFMISIGGLVIPNIWSYSTYSNSCSYSSSSSFSSGCSNLDDKTYNYVVLAIGIVCGFACIVFMVAMQCLLRGSCGNQGVQQIGYNPNSVSQPVNLNTNYNSSYNRPVVY